MAETRTDFVVQGKAKGFQEVQQQANKVIDAAQKATANQTKGFTKLEGGSRAFRKEIKQLDRELKDLTKQQLATTKAMEGMEKGTKVYRQLGQNLKDLNQQYSKLSGMKGKLMELFGPRAKDKTPLTAEDMAKGGFMQGLVQGSTGINLQRGPGMWRQAAGMAMGTMGRGFAGAAFGGVQAMQQGLAGIPIVGGFLGGQFGTAMGFGEGALEVQRTRLGAMPLFGGGGGGLQRMRQARARARAGVRAEEYAPEGGFLTQEEIGRRATARGAQAAGEVRITEDMLSEARKEQEAMTDVIARRRAREAFTQGEPTEYGLDLATRIKKEEVRRDQKLQARLKEVAEEPIFGAARRKAQADAERETRDVLAAPERRFKEAQEAAGARAAARERRRPFEDVRREGQRLGGLSEAESIQAVSPMLQRAGGGIEEARKQRMIPAAFAAQTVYGVGAETAGAFLGAGRRGGMVGAEGRGGEMFAETIGDALSLGLEGSELTEYMQQMANGFESWKQTGMPINPKSIAALSGTFANLGVGGARGSVLGQRMGGAAQRLTQTGVQDAMDLMMLQTVGGYKGGGMESYMEAMKKLEALGGPGQEIGSKEMNAMISQLYQAGGGGASGTWVVREALGRKGVQMGVGEAELVTKAAMRPQDLTEEERGKIGTINEQMMAGQERAPTGVSGLTRQAEEMMGAYGGAIRRAAALQNKQNSIGEALLPTLQGLQASSANITKAFQTLSDTHLNNVTKQIEKFTGAIEKIATMMDEGGNFWNVWSRLVTGAL
jgi:hypothetical protein